VLQEAEVDAANSRFAETIEKYELEKSALEADKQKLVEVQVKVSEKDTELAQLTSALAAAAEESRNKSNEIQSLTATVETLNATLSEAKVCDVFHQRNADLLSICLLSEFCGLDIVAFSCCSFWFCCFDLIANLQV
jgi:septal ring factor EnvC (AmiA/AmiB activator)